MTTVVDQVKYPNMYWGEVFETFAECDDWLSTFDGGLDYNFRCTEPWEEFGVILQEITDSNMHCEIVIITNDKLENG